MQRYSAPISIAVLQVSASCSWCFWKCVSFWEWRSTSVWNSQGLRSRQRSSRTMVSAHAVVCVGNHAAASPATHGNAVWSQKDMWGSHQKVPVRGICSGRTQGDLLIDAADRLYFEAELFRGSQLSRGDFNNNPCAFALRPWVASRAATLQPSCLRFSFRRGDWSRWTQEHIRRWDANPEMQRWGGGP